MDRPNPNDTLQRAIEDLLSQIPEFGPPYRDDEWVQDGNAYLVFGYGGFVSFVMEILRTPGNEPLLRRCFDLLEPMSNSPDKMVRDLTQIGFLEDLGKHDGVGLDTAVIQRARSFMGPRTSYLLDELEAFWDGRSDEFHRTRSNPWLT
jgi:hypothetical protein